MEQFATYTSGGSGWIFQSIEKLFLKVDIFNPLNGEGYIDLSQAVKTKRTTINVKMIDVFEYAIYLHYSMMK